MLRPSSRRARRAPESARRSNSRSLVAGGSHPRRPGRSARRPALRRRQWVTGHPLGRPASRLAADQGAECHKLARRGSETPREGCPSCRPAAAVSSREVRRSASTSSSARPAVVVSHPPREPPGALRGRPFTTTRARAQPRGPRARAPGVAVRAARALEGRRRRLPPRSAGEPALHGGGPTAEIAKALGEW
jgi:hypothetical protein